MSRIQVQGLKPLKGEIKIQGSKNAVLPMMAASVLHKGTTVLTHVPRIQDVFCMMGILEYMGCVCNLDGHRLTIDAKDVTKTEIPETYVKTMRSSIMILGALLGRAGEALTYYPGGCSIGKRPIDLHLYALRCLGADISEEESLIRAQAASLTGADIVLSYPSVGATENALLAAVLAEGETRIYGGAGEPEIESLCSFLNQMGADITIIAHGRFLVKGVKKLQDTVYRVEGDRIVAGTYLAAAATVGGSVCIREVNPAHLACVLPKFEKMGVIIRKQEDAIKIRCFGRPEPVIIKTGPYPGFPTDLQSPVMALLATGSGRSIIEENVFEGRYETVKELRKMGAAIIIEENRAYIDGKSLLTGGVVEAKDLRGGAALVLAGLAASGVTTVTGGYHIERGYEDICRDLSMLGATVQRI